MFQSAKRVEKQFHAAVAASVPTRAAMFAKRFAMTVVLGTSAITNALQAQDRVQISLQKPPAATGTLANNGVVATQATVFPGPSSRSTDENEFYRIGGQRFHFTAKRVNGKFTWSAVNKMARTTPTMRKTQKRDDRWYWHTLPTSGDDYLLLMWVNRDAGTIEWAAIKNSSEQWSVMSSKSTTVSHPRNDKQIKYRWMVTKENKIIDIDIYNPNNTNGWTSNDIWYGFGF